MAARQAARTLLQSHIEHGLRSDGGGRTKWRLAALAAGVALVIGVLAGISLDRMVDGEDAWRRVSTIERAQGSAKHGC